MGAMSTLRNQCYSEDDGWHYFQQAKSAKILDELDIFAGTAAANRADRVWRQRARACDGLIDQARTGLSR